MRYLLPLFILTSALEIAVLLLAGKIIGVFSTFTLIIITGFLGAYLAKSQGMQVFRKLQTDIQQGLYIGDAVLDGVCIFIGGLMLVSPGFVSDLAGLILLVPFTRKFLKPMIYKFIQRRFRNGNIIIMK